MGFISTMKVLYDSRPGISAQALGLRAKITRINEGSNEVLYNAIATELRKRKGKLE